MKLTLDCRDLTRLLSRSQDDMPPSIIRAQMRQHLVTCQSCRNVDEQMRFVRTAIKKLQLHSPCDTQFAERTP